MKRTLAGASSILHLRVISSDDSVSLVQRHCIRTATSQTRADIRLGADKSDKSPEQGRISSKNPSGQ
jgi:hypothetical protein